MTTAKRMADRMTEAAEEDLLLPYSLMLDALDRCDAGDGFPPAFRTAFLANLSDALDAYQAELAADPSGNTYWKHDRVVRVTELTPEQAAEELGSRTLYTETCQRIVWRDATTDTGPCGQPVPCTLHPES